MTPIASPTPIEIDLYPSGDGQPVAETFDHLYAILMTIEFLRLYLHGQQATVLGNQYLYYSQGYPKLRIAPDVMVIFDVAPGGIAIALVSIGRILCLTHLIYKSTKQIISIMRARASFGVILYREKWQLSMT